MHEELTELLKTEEVDAILTDDGVYLTNAGLARQEEGQQQ